MLRKIIVLCISIIVTIAGVIFLGYYDYNVYYNPKGDNGSTYSYKYKEYIRQNKVDVVNNNDYINQTREVTSLYRLMSGYKYIEEPIYSEKVTFDGKDLFYIDVYKSVVGYAPTGDTFEEREAIEVYVYSIDYDAIKDIFMKEDVLPASKGKVEKSDYPQLVVNFYPTNELNQEEALIYTSDGATISYTLYNGDKVYGSKLDTGLGFSIYDYNSNPKFNDSNEPYTVKYLLLRDYQSIANISDENDTIDSNNRARFADGAYITVDAIISVDGANYEYDLTPTTNKIEDFPFASKDLDLTGYKEGFSGDVKNIKIENLLTYNQYIFKKYVWWQCLIALFVLGGIMTLFYFTFTYEEKKPLKNKK